MHAKFYNTIAVLLVATMILRGVFMAASGREQGRRPKVTFEESSTRKVSKSEEFKKRFLGTEFGKRYCCEESIEKSSGGRCGCLRLEVRFNVVPQEEAVLEEMMRKFVEWCEKGKVIVIRNESYCERMGYIAGCCMQKGIMKCGNLSLIKLKLEEEWTCRNQSSFSDESICNVSKIIDIIDEKLEQASFKMEVTLEDQLLEEMARDLPWMYKLLFPSEELPAHCVWVYLIHSCWGILSAHMSAVFVIVMAPSGRKCE